MSDVAKTDTDQDKLGQVFYVPYDDLVRAYRSCDLGDSVGVRMYVYPHKDMMPDLVRLEKSEEPVANPASGHPAFGSIALSVERSAPLEWATASAEAGWTAREEEVKRLREALTRLTEFLDSEIAMLPCESRKRDLPEETWEQAMHLRDVGHLTLKDTVGVDAKPTAVGVFARFQEQHRENIRDCIPKALETIDALAIFAANHNCFTEPVRELVAVTSWLRGLAHEALAASGRKDGDV